jgi:hypothetical protein
MTNSSSTVNATPVAPPRFVNIAYWLFLLVALVHVVGLIISVVTFGSTTAAAKSQLSQTGSGVSSAQVNSLVGASLVTAIVIGVLYIIAFVLFDVFMRRGANWARIVLLIVTVLSLAGVLGAYGLGALGAIAAIVASILMFLRPSNEYFRGAKAAKLGRPAPQV